MADGRHLDDTQDEPREADDAQAEQFAARRRFLKTSIKGGAVAAPLVMTVRANPALAASSCDVTNPQNQDGGTGHGLTQSCFDSINGAG